jgi:amino acid adenylation domain-containing protein
VKRHEALRGVFSPDGRFMSILRYTPVEIEYYDFSQFVKEEKKNALADYLSIHANHVFDLIKGSLLKVGLIRVNALEHHLIITAHHIICDGWSFGIILEDLGTLYSAYKTNKTPSLPSVENFSSYADDEQEYVGSEEQAKTEKFWLDQYKDSVPVLNLPTDFPRPKLRTYKSEQIDFPFNTQLLEQLKKIGLKSGCSLVTTLMSAFEVFLYKQTGQDDIVIGLPSAGQAVNGRIHLVGHCVNLLPLRSKPDSNKSFRAYLKERKSSILDAYDHKQLSFGELLQKLPMQRDPSRVPLVPVVFNIDIGMTNLVNFYDLKFKVISNPRVSDSFEIFLNASDTKDDFILQWSYNSALFKPSTIENMMVDFEEVVKKIVENPDVNLYEIIKIDDSIYEKLNDTTVDYPDLPLHELLIKQAKLSSKKTAIKFHDVEITYENLEKQAHQLAHCLQEKGISQNDCVAVMLPRSNELIITLMAILECGASYLPLDPSYPKKRLEFMLEDSEAKCIITTKTTSATLQSTASPLFLEDLLSELSKQPNNPLDLNVSNDNIAYILYTSGSTGKPKGVTITHKNLVNLLYSFLERPGIKETDTLISITTISFDIAMAELFAPLLKGATLVLTDEETAKDARMLLDVMKDESITMMQATPATWQMLLDSGWNEQLSIRAISTGEALPLGLAKNILAQVDELWNLYGPTETTIWSAYAKIEKTDELIPIGHPMANTQLYIINEQGVLVAPGIAGELCIAGDGVAKGYWKRPELTSEKFVTNPFNKHLSSTLYRTGDLAILMPSGKVKCLGRIDQQVKIRGQRIELGEIEDALNVLNGVKSSIVLLNDDRLVANLITSDIDDQDNNQMKNWKDILNEYLPKHMIPEQFNLLKEFPQTLNGKIDRKALSKFLPNTDANKVGFTGPSGPSEKIIAAIWQDCLGLEKIDVNSDFFEIGGHSLVGVRIMVKIEKETGNRLPLAGLLKHPTIKKFAAYMDRESFTWDSLVPLKTQGTKPPLYIIHGANHQVLIFDALAKYLDKDQPVYGLQSRGLDGYTEPHDSIDDMAADYIEEIVASNPDGPYALAGFSYGGIVAYEMARQLKAQGKEVTILAQFDTYIYPAYYFKSALKKKILSITYLLGKMVYLLFNMFSSKKNFIRRTDLLKLKLKGWYLRFKHGKEKQYEEQFNVSSKMYENHNIATSRYTITPQDIVVDLFRADEEVNFVHDHKFLGWSKMAGKGIRKHMVHGNHVDMFEKPHVKNFADKLQHVLDKYNLDTYE